MTELTSEWVQGLADLHNRKADKARGQEIEDIVAETVNRGKALAYGHIAFLLDLIEREQG